MFHRLCSFVLSLVACATILLGPLWSQTSAAARPGYSITTIGNMADVVTAPQGGIALIGGGSDLDTAFQWIIDRSDGGDVVVIRASGDDAYNSYLFTLGNVSTAPDSVTTIVFHQRAAAADPAVLDIIEGAEALVIAGGDQAEYLALWQGTPLIEVVEARAGAGMVIGGTSAGAMILGEHVYSAARGSIGSRAALRDPFDRRVTLSSRLINLPALDETIIDTHFSERNRRGRLLTFLARLERVSDGPVRGIGLDESTALLVAPSGKATIVGDGRALLLDMATGAERCRRGKSLTVRAQPGAWGSSGDAFAIGAWTGEDLEPVVVSAVQGRLREAPLS